MEASLVLQHSQLRQANKEIEGVPESIERRINKALAEVDKLCSPIISLKHDLLGANDHLSRKVTKLGAEMKVLTQLSNSKPELTTPIPTLPGLTLGGQNNTEQLDRMNRKLWESTSSLDELKKIVLAIAKVVQVRSNMTNSEQFFTIEQWVGGK